MKYWIVLCLLVLPTVAAHGAPEPRAIDERILADTTSSGDYGAGGALGNGALDLLALDVFEGTIPGTLLPAVVFRIIVQDGEAGDHTIVFTGKAEGQAFTLDLTTKDLTTYDSTTFDAVRGPYDVGDGHPKAIEAFIGLDVLGIQPGGDLSDIRVTSQVGGNDEDVMPGTWFLGGQAVPLPPNESPGAPGAYTTSGPGAFVTAEASIDVLETGPQNFTIDVTNAVGMAQVIEVFATAPAGMNVSVPPIIDLPDGTKTIAVETDGIGVGSIKVFLHSDLGSATLVSVPVDSSANVGLGGNVESGEMFAGDAFQYTFTQAATFDYHCHPHPWMLGVVTIEEAANGTVPERHIVRIVEPDAGDPNSWRFEPAELTIHAGDTVVWINDGAMMHDVRGSTGLGPDGHDHDHHDHDHGPPPSEDSPGPLLVLPLLAALLLRRRG